MAADGIIDVWDASTFDQGLLERLTAHTDTIVDYYARDHAIFLEHELGRGAGRSILRPDNRHAAAFIALKEGLMADMAERTIRAWHYTRLTDSEVAALQADGPHLSTVERLRARVDALAASGALQAASVEVIWAASPLHSDQHDARSGKFWMVSHPAAVTDGGVRPLLSHWGGEVANMRLDDEDLLARLAAIGKARVIEVGAPLAATRHAYSTAEGVVATFARANGAIPEKHAFDLYARTALPPTAILAVHTEGEGTFATIGRGYPSAYVDVALGRWKELTGEDDDA